MTRAFWICPAKEAWRGFSLLASKRSAFIRAIKKISAGAAPPELFCEKQLLPISKSKA